jgi:hypothetical protein
VIEKIDGVDPLPFSFEPSHVHRIHIRIGSQILLTMGPPIRESPASGTRGCRWPGFPFHPSGSEKNARQDVTPRQDRIPVSTLALLPGRNTRSARQGRDRWSARAPATVPSLPSNRTKVFPRPHAGLPRWRTESSASHEARATRRARQFVQRFPSSPA